MRRSAVACATIILLFCFCDVAASQTAITGFSHVAGQWHGYTSPHRHKVTLEIDPTGRFSAGSLLGSESGEARLEGGVLVVPLPKHDGALRLELDGATLKGQGTVAGHAGDVRLTRREVTRASE